MGEMRGELGFAPEPLLPLLVYLARWPRRARTREHLIGLLWSERDDKSARHSLSEALRVFRRVLGDARVRADVDQVSLAEGAVTLDCDELAARSAAQDWAGAARVATGDFLEGLSVPDANDFQNWVARRPRGRDRVRRSSGAAPSWRRSRERGTVRALGAPASCCSRGSPEKGRLDCSRSWSTGRGSRMRPSRRPVPFRPMRIRRGPVW